MLKNVEEKMKEFQNLEEIKRELKRLQSLKCNLKKNKFQKDYEAKMTAILQEEQLMKEVRDLFNPRKKFVTELLIRSTRKSFILLSKFLKIFNL